MSTQKNKSKFFLFRFNPSLRFWISFICLVTITISGTLVAYKSLTELYENSIRDAWAILFLELEKVATGLSEDVNLNADNAKRGTPDAEFLLLANNEVKSTRQTWTEYKKLKQLGIDPSQLSRTAGIRTVVTSLQGDSYLVERGDTPQGSFLRLYRMSLSRQLKAIADSKPDTVIYVLNRSGKLIFSNSLSVTPENVYKRPLVAAFTAAPFSQGQSEFEMKRDSLYGFHQEIKNTNLVIFAEKSKQRTLQGVYATMIETGKFTLLIIISSIALLQFPLSKLTNPIRELAFMAQEIARGNFGIVVAKHGVGELRTLTSAFEQMISSLRTRDEAIRSLNQSMIKKVQLDNDLKVASTIQERFLFKPNIAPGSGIEVKAVYVPATQVAGDWYGVYNNSELDETILAIVDITGHGIGSAMMTPIISLLFYEYMSSGQSFDGAVFIKKCNSVLFAYGGGQCTATAIVVKIEKRLKKMTAVNAGHPAPTVIHADQTTSKGSLNQKGANILGLESSIDIATSTLDLLKGDLVVVFSDGLFHTSESSAVHKRFGRKELSNAINASKGRSPQDVIDSIIVNWRNTIGAESADDDMCAIVGLVT